jgi:YD repeat-containing protein
MQRMRIEHTTRYVYDQPVSFTEHRLLIRPRDSHAMRLLEASLTVSPPGEVHWRYDALGNCVCIFTPNGSASELVITSSVLVERFPAILDDLVDDPSSRLPVIYSPADHMVLAPMLGPETDDPDGVIVQWLRELTQAANEPALDVIQRMSATIHFNFDYIARYEEGIQTPVQTLEHRSGTCRDFAWLMVEALRRLGVAARFVTGYLYSPNANVRGAGSTHAWVEAFLPHRGWLEFDPTNGLAESPDLIPVAAARTPQEASPISGGLIGDPGGSTLTVSVDVSLES